MIDPAELAIGLEKALARVGLGAPEGLMRLTGGATMESWQFEASGGAYVLRRAPSLEFMEDRPYGHDVEAGVIRAAHARGVTAPEVVAELQLDDGSGSGFVMRALPGTPNPKEILAMEDPQTLLQEAARDLARIHSLTPADVPDGIPTMQYREAIADLRQQFEGAGGDRPIIALGLKWMEDNCPEPVEPVLNHGDYRLGNLLAQDSHLTGVLDWELAHFGDPHEDLAFGCMAVWRFARYDRPALGLGSLEDYFAAYEAESGRTVDRKRFRYWMIHRTVWWALGCLRMAKHWRTGQDRMLERVVISRRTSEQELDLLMLLEEEAPPIERLKSVSHFSTQSDLDASREHEEGEASDVEIMQAILELLSDLKPKLSAHDQFQVAVAKNALGIISRETVDGAYYTHFDEKRPGMILRGETGLSHPGYLSRLRMLILAKVEVDSPKYPALAVARKKWTGED